MSSEMSQFRVVPRAVPVKKFIGAKRRADMVQDGEILILTNKNDPFAFVVSFPEDGMGLFDLHPSVRTYNARDLLRDYNKTGEDEVDVAVFHPKSKSSDQRYIYWNLKSFIAVMGHPAIHVPSAVQYYLRNHLEKPLYKQSPSLSFSEHGFLTQYATAMGRFSGPSASIVCDNHLPVQITGNQNDYLLLPKTERTDKIFEHFEKKIIEGAFYTQFEKNVGALNNKVAVATVYDKSFFIVSIPAAGALPSVVRDAVAILDSKSDSIARHVRQGRQSGSSEAALEDDPVRRQRRMPTKGHRRPPEETPAGDLSLQELAGILPHQVLSDRFNLARANSGSALSCAVGRVSLTLCSGKVYRDVFARIAEDRKINYREFETPQNGRFAEDHPVLQALFNAQKGEEFCFVVEDVVMVGGDSNLANIVDAMGALDAHPEIS